MTTPTPSPTCRDCGGSGRIRNVTIGRPPGANAETVACPCASGHESRTVDGYHYSAAELTDAAATALPTTNPYAEERARGEALFAAGYPALAAAARGELDPDVRRLASIAIRRSVAAMDLIESGVDVTRFATGDLLAHYDRVVAPRAGANLAKAREAKAEEKARRDADRPMVAERLVGHALGDTWTSWKPEGHGGPRFRPEARHDGEIIPEPEPEPEPGPEPADPGGPFAHVGGRFVTTTDEVTRIIAAGGRVVVGADFGSGDGNAWVTCAVAPDGSINVLDSGTGEPAAADEWLTPKSVIADVRAAICDVMVSNPPQRPRTFAVGDRVRIVAPDSPGTGTVVAIDDGMHSVARDDDRRLTYGQVALVHLIGEDAYPEAVTRREAWAMWSAAARESEASASRVPDGMREFLTREMQEFRTDFRDISDVVAKFDPTISVLGVTWSFPSKGVVDVKIECARGMVDTFDVELSFQPPAPASAPTPALARIPDDYLLAIIAGSEDARIAGSDGDS